MTNTLATKNILVAGGSGRIGWTIVKDIVARGGSVITFDTMLSESVIDEMNTYPELAEKISFRILDICNESDVVKFFTQLPEVSGAVNCTYPRGKNYGRDFLSQDLDSFNSTISAHLGSSYLFTQQCVKYFNNNEADFSLVNFSSIYGEVAPDFSIYEGTPMTVPPEYALMKAAIQHLNKYVSSYVRDSRFRINTVAPGGILDGQPESFIKAYKSITRGTGMLQSSDIVGAVVFLLSDASKYITGQNILIDDGFSN